MNENAVKTFVAYMGEIIEKADALKELAENHMGLSPYEIDSNHVATADQILEMLNKAAIIASIK